MQLSLNHQVRAVSGARERMGRSFSPNSSIFFQPGDSGIVATALLFVEGPVVYDHQNPRVHHKYQALRGSLDINPLMSSQGKGPGAPQRSQGLYSQHPLWPQATFVPREVGMGVRGLKG